ncbi:MAG: hypothetical protein KIT00_10415 [Rhodospirillales bacterium]|nr:hypothetical protein [Rhodospirillales bacterium]
MTLDRDVNDVRWTFSGSFVWLLLVSALFGPWAFRSSYWALVLECVSAIVTAVCVALVVAGAVVWLDANGTNMIDAVQAMRVGQAMRYEVREFIDMALTDRALGQKVANQSWTILIRMLTVLGLVYACRFAAVRLIKRDLSSKNQNSTN